MAGNVTSPVRNIADVTKDVAAGDVSKKKKVDVNGEILSPTMLDPANGVTHMKSEHLRALRVNSLTRIPGLNGNRAVVGISVQWNVRRYPRSRPASRSRKAPLRRTLNAWNSRSDLFGIEFWHVPSIPKD
jgi:hypothetical protein